MEETELIWGISKLKWLYFVFWGIAILLYFILGPNATAGCLAFGIFFSVLTAIINKSLIIVTDKRIHGKSAFGRSVNIPLDSVSAVETSFLNGIVVASSAGRIAFWGISNRDAIVSVINDLLVERQNKSFSPPQAVRSDAEEIEKYKDLLDKGIITQEEFDAKKKQLLGL